jgi:hypothetical protein
VLKHRYQAVTRGPTDLPVDRTITPSASRRLLGLSRQGRGNFLVQEEATGQLASSGVDGLETLLVTDCPLLEWQAVVYDTGRSVIGI